LQKSWQGKQTSKLMKQKSSSKHYSKTKLPGLRVPHAVKLFCHTVGIGLHGLSILQNGKKTAIFLNLPYAKKYENLRIIISAVVAIYGLSPLLVKNMPSAGKQRLPRIIHLMTQCKYAITDLSDNQSFNMPFELALLLAFGKPVLILEKSKYWHQQFFSDILGCDPASHGGRRKRIIKLVSEWIWKNIPSHRFKKKCIKEPLNLSLLEKFVDIYKAMITKSISEEQIIKMFLHKYFKIILLNYQQKNIKSARQALLALLNN